MHFTFLDPFIIPARCQIPSPPMQSCYGEETVKSTIGEAFRCGKTQRDKANRKDHKCWRGEWPSVARWYRLIPIWYIWFFSLLIKMQQNLIWYLFLGNLCSTVGIFLTKTWYLLTLAIWQHLGSPFKPQCWWGCRRRSWRPSRGHKKHRSPRRRVSFVGAWRRTRTLIRWEGGSSILRGKRWGRALHEEEEDEIFILYSGSLEEAVVHP